MHRYDVIVAGAGTGGSAAAIQPARLGARVLLIEESGWIGGQMSAVSSDAASTGSNGSLTRAEITRRLSSVNAGWQPVMEAAPIADDRQVTRREFAAVCSAILTQVK